MNNNENAFVKALKILGSIIFFIPLLFFMFVKALLSGSGYKK